MQRLCSAELLDLIESHGGDIRVTDDGDLECRNVPAELVPEIERLQFVLTSILRNEPLPDVVPSKPKKNQRRQLGARNAGFAKPVRDAVPKGRFTNGWTVQIAGMDVGVITWNTARRFMD